MKQLKFKISPDGAKVEVEGIGIKGKQCLENNLTKGVLEALGEVGELRKKSEYYISTPTGVKIRG